MDEMMTCTHRGVFAGLIAALAGRTAAEAAPRPQVSGNGGQGALILGSNDFNSPNSVGPDTANVSSVATDLKASPNYGNFTQTSGAHVLGIDARPAGTAQVNGVQAYGSGGGNGILGVGGPDQFGPGAGVVGVMGGVALPNSALGAGVYGVGGDTGYGVQGSGLVGVFGFTTSTVGAALLGIAADGVGVGASSSTGVGASLAGGRAPLLLKPATTSGHPASGTHTMGELYVDATGGLWCCTADGTPGTWVGLTAAATVPSFRPLPTPERFVDTRAGLGGTTGPLPDAATHVFQMTGRAGLSGNTALIIPDGATAIVGNLSVIGGAAIPVGSFVTMWPGGPQPTTASITVGPGGVVSNFFVLGLANASGHGSISVFNQHTCDYVIDVSGYYAA